MDHAMAFPAVTSRAALPAESAAAVFGSTDQHGRSLDSLSRERPLLLVFLRHLGCTFCREAATDVSVQREAIEREGVTPAFVGMMEDAALG
ncbi:MAG: hypothetical protein M8841_08945, partial [marine benthic group bacterium]|nr:hypothetical protein [Gemmatimonadota bacterium]